MSERMEKTMKNDNKINNFKTRSEFFQFSRKNNIVVAGMYAMYLTGKSLEEVGKIYHKTRQAVYDQFKARGYKLRSKELKGLQILDGIKFTRFNKGLRGTVNGKRMTMHKYVWEKYNCAMPSDCGIIHLNGNNEDNRIENLKCLTIKEISSKYSPHLNQFTSPTGSRIKSNQRWKTDRDRIFHEKFSIGRL